MFEKFDNYLIQFLLYRYFVGGTFIKLTSGWIAVYRTQVLEDGSKMFILQDGFSVHEDFIKDIEIYGVSY